MMFRLKAMGSALAAAAAMAIGLGAASSASATVIIGTFQNSPLSGVNTDALLPFVIGGLKKGNIYEFNFELVPPLDPSGTTETQIQAQAQVGTKLTAELIFFDLYSGTAPVSGTPVAGTYIGSSLPAFSSVLAESLVAGDYYVRIAGAQIAKSGEFPSGSVITTAVPEPATWAVMLVGFGAIGATMRGARRKRAALAA